MDVILNCVYLVLTSISWEIHELLTSYLLSDLVYMDSRDDN